MTHLLISGSLVFAGLALWLGHPWLGQWALYAGTITAWGGAGGMCLVVLFDPQDEEER